MTHSVQANLQIPEERPLIERAMPPAMQLMSSMGALAADPAVAGCAAVLAARLFAHVLASQQGRPINECDARCEQGIRYGLDADVQVTHGQYQPVVPPGVTIN